jgi:cytochrome c
MTVPQSTVLEAVDNDGLRFYGPPVVVVSGDLLMRRSLHIAALLAMPAVVWPLSVHAADAVAGQAVFKSQCSICHSPLDGKNMVGPSLFGVIGRKSGSVAGFHYSAANKAADITWNADILNKYLTSPRDVVPGTIMTYAGLKDDAKRADLIAYLETLH